MKFILYTMLTVMVFLVIPEFSLAQTGFEGSPEIGRGTFNSAGTQRLESYTGPGLVACNGPDCNFCSLMATASNVVDLLFQLLVIVAVILIVFAGFKLVVSGGDVSAYQSAKSMLTNVIIGFVIVLSAWLIVDTIFKMLVKEDNGVNFKVWDRLEGVSCGGIKSGPLQGTGQ